MFDFLEVQNDTTVDFIDEITTKELKIESENISSGTSLYSGY